MNKSGCGCFFCHHSLSSVIILIIIMVMNLAVLVTAPATIIFWAIAPATIFISHYGIVPVIGMRSIITPFGIPAMPVPVAPPWISISFRANTH